MKRWLAVTVTGAVLALGAPAGAQSDPVKWKVAVGACEAFVRTQFPGEQFWAYVPADDPDRVKFLGSVNGRWLFKKCLTDAGQPGYDIPVDAPPAKPAYRGPSS